jgi:hypothetical protein
MKKMMTIALAAFLSIACLYAKGQAAKDACSLITDEQLNKILSCKVTQSGPSTVKGKHCVHKSADAKYDIVIEYYDWHNEKTAKDMMKRVYDQNKNDISANKKAVGIYTAFKDFPEGGQYAYVMTGDGDIYSNGNVVRLQYLAGNLQFTFDTRGLDKNKVLPKLKEILSMINSNNR